MKKILALMTIFIVSSLSHAGEAKFSLLNENGNIDTNKVHDFVLNIGTYVRQYPPHFKSEEQQQKLTSDTKNAVQELTKANLSSIKDVDLLIDIAFLYAMAHNLDLGTAPNAKNIYEQALSINPNNKKANYLFGMFLISTKKFHFDSEQYLQKALNLGESDALYSLALLQLQKGNKEKGLEMLEKYSNNSPNNEHARKVIKAIKDGKLKFRTSNGG